MEARLKTDKPRYGFHVGQVVVARVPIRDEAGADVPAGTHLRIAGIAPKVYYTSPARVQRFPWQFDTKLYFVNLVRAEQPDDHYPRFREHFVTIRKLKRGEFDRSGGVDICVACDGEFPPGTLPAVSEESFDLICPKCEMKKPKKPNGIPRH